MIGVGIVGCNYGRTVLLPAFRTDPRCEVVALAGSDGARTAELARAVEVARGFGDWRALIEDRAVTAVAVAVPPDLQPEVARHALDLGKPVFVEKPLAADLTAARGMVEAARRSGQPTIIDFNFPELPSWRRAKEILDSGALGRLRHVVVTWNVENQATRLRLKSWKTRAGEGGGGLLGNFVSHCFYYLEWFLGPIAGLGGRVFPLPDGDAESSIALAIAFASGVGGSLQMSCASFLGSGHRLEFYGEDGTLVLANPTADYFRGFQLMQAGRADSSLQPVATEDASADRFSRFPRRTGGAAGATLRRRVRAGRFPFARLRRRLSRAGPDRCGASCACIRPLDRRRAVGRGGASVSAQRVLVTGGSGFIGSALVKALVRHGDRVRVFDDNSRGALRRLREVDADVEFVAGDIRDPAAVDAAMRGIDEVHHLAFVNGTATFYSAPELVLDVGVKGMVNVIDACRHWNVGRLVLASSSEVYQSPPQVPTDESVPLVVPDPLNPRLSYGAGKIISEMMAINYGRRHFERVLIFRPHNVYGPDMGFDHVIPQFAVRLKRTIDAQASGPLSFDIQGSGEETRSFCHVDDLVQGVMVMREKGEHLNIYHIGTTEEVSIADLARRMAAIAGREIALRPSAVLAGSTPRRCPDVSKLAALGYAPRVPLDEGLPPTLKWYWDHESMAPAA